jgi:glycosyltransferase involved in cell wall biosynthesis
MRILWLITRYWPAVGGAELHSRQIIHALAAKGHTVCVVAHWDANRTDWLRGTTVGAPRGVRRYADGPAVHVIRLGVSPVRRLATALPAAGFYLRPDVAAPALAAPLEGDIERLCGAEWDVVHGVRVGREPLYLAGYQFARRHGIPFVFTPLHHPRWVGWRYRVYLDLYRRASALIALTEHERALYETLGVARERVHISGIGPIVPAAVDGDRFRAAHAIHGPLVLFLGQKYPHKGYSRLLEVAPHVWRRWPETTFAFLGPRTAASRFVFARVADRRILELDAVDLQTKGDALAACDVFCLPSEQESFGGVYTEAWTYRKPVIGADIPATREVIAHGEDGLIAGRGSADSLAEHLVTLLADPALRARLGAAGQRKVRQHYTWTHIAAQVESTYTAALAQGTR